MCAGLCSLPDTGNARMSALLVPGCLSAHVRQRGSVASGHTLKPIPLLGLYLSGCSPGLVLAVRWTERQRLAPPGSRDAVVMGSRAVPAKLGKVSRCLPWANETHRSWASACRRQDSLVGVRQRYSSISPLVSSLFLIYWCLALCNFCSLSAQLELGYANES